MLIVVALLAACSGRSGPDGPSGDGDADTDGSFTRCGALYCAPDMACCDDECADLSTHSSHCGACGHACADDETCEEGGCVPRVEPCVFTECDGVCTNVWESRDHCGACGAPCAIGSACLEGVCTPGDGTDCGSCVDPRSACCESACVSLSDRAHCGACDVQCPDDLPDCADGDCTVILI